MIQPHGLLVGREISHVDTDDRWGGGAGGGPRAYSTTHRPHNKLQPLKDQPLIYEGDSHLVTIAGTGAGKGRSVIIPNLLKYDGPVVVFDPKGENYAVTARQRRAMNHRVFKLDPFKKAGDSSDSLNPFDMFSLSDAVLEADSQTLADLLYGGVDGGSPTSAEWDALGLYSGLIAHVASPSFDGEKSFGSVWDLLSDTQATAKLEVLLGQQRDSMNSMAQSDISAFLQLPLHDSRPAAWGAARRFLKALQTPEVRQAVSSSSFDIQDFVAGETISLYIIIPPERLRSHSTILRLWIGLLLRAISSRVAPPAKRTLFILDECGKLGYFKFLEEAITLCRAYGMQVWSFWQDLAQLESVYPSGWKTMLTNCDVLQFFGAGNQKVSDDFAQLLGTAPDEAKRLRRSEQIVVMKGGEPWRSSRYDYLYDVEFAGMWDQNPAYTPIEDRYSKKVRTYVDQPEPKERSL